MPVTARTREAQIRFVRCPTRGVRNDVLYLEGHAENLLLRAAILTAVAGPSSNETTNLSRYVGHRTEGSERL